MKKSIYNNYLKLEEHGEVRSRGILHVLILTDLMGLFTLLGPSELTFALPIATVLGIILNVWALLYLIAPYRFESSFFLFFGTWGLFTSFIMFLVIQKFLYNIFQYHSLQFFYISLTLYILCIIGVQVLHLLFLYERLTPPKGPRRNWTPLVAITPALSYVIGQLVYSMIVSEDIKALIFVACESLLILYPIFCIKFIHQYYFLIKNKQSLNEKYPNLNLPKKNRKLG
ncbi:hypothetical protein [Halobacillus naozhouensis]|uniref:Uncharacterized protein n=1 Tax=Halobacillus naozhouensis TaxID=554880 RepID=A0ABY8IXN8_9BACI|nr:hypothetical protein [Halobacillus naozhouensis]WFT73944.1 hypothetical protein P9989_16440 [Halobacillus naozhouensis]